MIRARVIRLGLGVRIKVMIRARVRQLGWFMFLVK